MKAVVMAGGQGTRLRPLTSNIPKPMVTIGNKPCALHILELLQQYGIEDVVMTVGFMSEVIRGYFGDGSSLGMTIDYAVEESPLGTAGSVKNAEAALDDTFLIVSGDSLTDFDLSAIISFHEERDALVTIALKSVENPLEFGVVIVDDDGHIEQFVEKPGWGQVFSDTINTGVYVMEPEVLSYIPAGVPYDFSHELFPKLFELRKPLYGCIQDRYWQDIGTLEQYLQANRDALDGKVRLRLPGVKLRGNVWVGEGVSIDSLDHVRGPALIGNYVRVEPGVELGPYAVLGNNVVVKTGAGIASSVLGDGCYVAGGARVTGAVLGVSVDVRSMAVVCEGAVIGDKCSVGENAIVGSGVKVYPFKHIDPGSSVKSSLIWESRGRGTLFGKVGVRGIVNVDVTPETAMRLAMSYGTLLPKGSYVTTSRDSHAPSRMLKRAMIVGLNSAGVSVRDLEVAPVSVNRFDLQTGQAAGGIHVRMSAADPEVVEILFSEPPGIPIDAKRERSIENSYSREDFRRAFLGDIGAISFPIRAVDGYRRACLEGWRVGDIQQRGLRVALFAPGPSGAALLMGLAGELGVQVLTIGGQGRRQEPDVSTGHLVRAMEADAGFVMDGTGERLQVIDERGEPLPSDILLRLLATQACRDYGPGIVAVPLNATALVDEVVTANGGRVVRTKVSEAVLMAESSRPDVVFAADSAGGFIYPRFSPSFDAVYTFGKVLELLAQTPQTLSELASEFPPSFMAHITVECPWHLKGLAMRLTADDNKGERVSLVDGIKILYGPRTWVQILPDSDDPLFHIYAEAPTAAAAEELARVQEEKLEARIAPFA